MSGDGVREFVRTEVERFLVLVSTVGGGRVEQGQSEGVVIRLVPSVSAVVHDGNTVTAVRGRQVGPFLGGHFVSGFGVVAPQDVSESEIVGGFGGSERERESGFQERTAGFPIHVVANIDPVVTGTVVEDDSLGERGFLVAAVNPEDGGKGTFRLHADSDAGVDGKRFPVDDALHNLPGRPGIRRVLVKDLQSE